MTFTTTEQAAAWLSGFIDGEGCVGFYPGATPALTKRGVTVSNTDPLLVEAAKEASDMLGLRYTERWHSDANRTAWGGKPLGTLSYHHRTTYERMLATLTLRGEKAAKLAALVGSYNQAIKHYERRGAA